MDVQIANIWQDDAKPANKMLQIDVVKPKLSVKGRKDVTPDGFVDKHSKVDSLSTAPIFVHISSGSIVRVFTRKDEDISSVNLKKGIASMLQVNKHSDFNIFNTYLLTVHYI